MMMMAMHREVPAADAPAALPVETSAINSEMSVPACGEIAVTWTGPAAGSW